MKGPWQDYCCSITYTAIRQWLLFGAELWWRGQAKASVSALLTFVITKPFSYPYTMCGCSTSSWTAKTFAFCHHSQYSSSSSGSSVGYRSCHIILWLPARSSSLWALNVHKHNFLRCCRVVEGIVADNWLLCQRITIPTPVFSVCDCPPILWRTFCGIHYCPIQFHILYTHC